MIDCRWLRTQRTVVSILAIFLAGSIANAAPGGGAAASDFQVNELIVQLDPIALNLSVPNLVSQIQRAGPLSSLYVRFASPQSVRLLESLRLPDELLFSLADYDPEYRLQNRVVLAFSDDEATDRAIMILARDKGVLSISRNAAARYSTDPLIPIVSDTWRYQWGLYAMNVIQSGNPIGVWAKTRGSAYVALLDNGIKTSGGVHEDLVANYRKQFSYNYGFWNNGPDGVSSAPDNLDETPFSGYMFAGHGTHTAGVLAAKNDNGLGGSGVCSNCSFASGRISAVLPSGQQLGDIIGPYIYPDLSLVAQGLSDLSRRGIQVINISFGNALATCGTQQAVCDALAVATARDVVLVAASGNHAVQNLEFPATQSGDVIAVGGIQYPTQFWSGGNGIGSNWSVTPVAQQFVAPAVTAISSMYTGFDWAPDPPFYCGDSLPASFAPGYGTCTGTSMAAPYVAGVAGLIRSVWPLSTKQEVRNVLAATSNISACTSANCQLGIPDATAAVIAALGGANVLNRTSPLFSFYSSAALDHFYTYVPQMAMAALAQGALRPQPLNGTSISYQGIGVTSSQYVAFPTTTCSPTPCSNTPRAIAVLYTTHVGPSGGADLVPLYRMSYRCGDEQLTTPPNPVNAVCISTPAHLSHFYATDEVAVRLYTGYATNGIKDPSYPGLGYALDGIEGFLYSNATSQPSGTVKLCRKYDSTRDDYVLFTGSGVSGTDCSATSDGYTGGNYGDTAGGTDWIGWVLPATATYGPVPANALPTVSVTSPSNGAVLLAGTDVGVKASASDGDGSIGKVRFYLEQKLLGEDTTSPYKVTWPSVQPGTWHLTAIAVDNRGAIKASTITTVTVAGMPTFQDAGFQTPLVGAGNYSYNPASPYWTYTPATAYGGSGVAGNNSAVTVGNPDAPSGGQVAFIQGIATVTQSVAFGATGTYHIEFYAAQRFTNQHVLQLQIYIDGVPKNAVPIQPYSTTYALYVSDSFSVAAGTHTIQLRGVNPYGDDNTLLIDTVSFASP